LGRTFCAFQLKLSDAVWQTASRNSRRRQYTRTRTRNVVILRHAGTIGVQ